MENSNEEALFRGRSSRSCVRMGCQLYLSNFRRLLKATWMPAVLFALCFSVVGTIAVIQYPRLNLNAFVNPETAYTLLDDSLAIFVLSAVAIFAGGLVEIATYSCAFRLLDEHRSTGKMAKRGRWFEFDRHWAWRALKGFVCSAIVCGAVFVLLLAISYAASVAIGRMGGKAMVTTDATVVFATVLFLLSMPPMFYVVVKYMLDREQKFWPSLLSNLKCGIRHYGQLFVAIVMTVIILLIVSVILLLPAIVVALANFHANLGVLFGDPLGMPSYIVPLTAVVMAFAGFVEVILRCGFHFIGYYCYGSIDTQEEEKKKFNQEIQNI